VGPGGENSVGPGENSVGPGNKPGGVSEKAERASRRVGGVASRPILARAYFLLGKTPVPLVPP
jgi:hypothetical protein